MSKDKDIILMIIPALVLIAVLMLYPVVQCFIMSFTEQMLYELEGKWVGLKNYAKLLKDPEFWQSFKITIVWTFGTVIFQTILGVGSALLLYKKFFGRGLVRAFTLLPFFTPGVSIYLVWRWMYNDISGIFNHILMASGIIGKPILWLATPKLALFSVIIMATWRYFPFVMINILARLESIPESLFDAAKVDGANSWQIFWNVTIPQIREVLLIVVFLRVIWMSQKFEELFVVTGGGPAGSTTTLALLSYEQAFGAMRLGYASAINVIIFVILVIMAAIYITVFKPTEQTV
ncbi:MAG TPA: sugar ABC transporter permease [Defluviitaleaceae bacterium]|mgnify:CR=1 FL=1|nr:sugar ABC transporter permease [Defluviitaleaceae bacterium]